MNIRDEKLFKKLQIYFEMGQSIAIINPIDAHTKRIVQFFEKEILKSSDVIYVDFNAIKEPCDLAKIILKQCKKIMSKYPYISIDTSTINYSSDYQCLDRTLNLSQEIAEQINKDITFISKNYTNVLILEEGKRIQKHMRSIFQRQHNVYCIFTGDNQDSLNKIFMDSSAPFLRFAEIIDTTK